MTAETPPDSSEWDTSNLPAERRTYLDEGHSFEEIANLVSAEAEVREAWIEPYRDTRDEAEKKTRQICFRVQVTTRTYDLLYNAPDGLRGRYWQSPGRGDAATRRLIALLKPILLEFAERNPPQPNPEGRQARKIQRMTPIDIQVSLDAHSAKVWVREKDDAGNTKITTLDSHQLMVKKWNKSQPSETAPWRWTPCETEIEVKGALIDQKYVPYVPKAKEGRSDEIHLHGFT